MTLLQIALATAVAVLLVLAWWMLRQSGKPPTARQTDRLDTVIGWPPQATRVLSAQERMAFSTLTRALPDHLVLAQVPLARFLSVPKRNSYADWLRRVGYQSVDFVVCDLASQVMAVVELQALPASDRARKRTDRIARTLKAAKIPLHVWNEGALPSPDAARAALLPPALEPLSTPMPLAPEPAERAPPGPIGRTPAANPFDDTGRDSAHDERIEFLEPPPTWYDDIDSGATPLDKPK